MDKSGGVLVPCGHLGAQTKKLNDRNLTAHTSGGQESNIKLSAGPHSLGPREEPVPCLPLLAVTTGILVYGCISLCSVFPLPSRLSSLLSISLIRTTVTAFSAHPDNAAEMLSLKIVNLSRLLPNIAIVTLLPYKV